MLKKMKRALALGAVAAIALLFMVTLILAFIDTEKARELLMASIVATIVIPTLTYAYLWLVQRFTQKKEDEIYLRSHSSAFCIHYIIIFCAKGMNS